MDRTIHIARKFRVEEHEYPPAERWQGGTITRIVHPGAVVILPVDSDGRFLLLKQYRPAIEETIWELPAGTMEKGEPPEECAKRELREETGYAARKWTPLGNVYSAPGFCTELLRLFLAEDLFEAPLTAEDTARIEVERFKPDELRAMIADGRVHDAKTLAALYLWELRRI